MIRKGRMASTPPAMRRWMKKPAKKKVAKGQYKISGGR